MSLKINQYARTPAAVVVALGMKLSKQRRKKAEQLEEAIAWTQWEDFPKKTAQGWPILGILEWRSRNVVRIGEEKARREAEREVFSGRPVKKATLKLLQEDQGGERVTSQDHMAEILTRKFGRAVSAKDISDWKNGKRIPSGAPAFPAPSPRGGWNSADDGMAWYERWVEAPLKQSGAQGVLFENLNQLAKQAELQEQIDAAAIKAFELEQLRKADDKNYITVQRALEQASMLGTVVNQQINLSETAVKSRFAQCPNVMALADEVRGPLLADLMMCLRENAEGMKGEIAAVLRSIA